MSTSAVRAGQAYIELTTKNAKLVKGLQNAQAQLKAFGTAVNSLGKKFVGVAAGLALPLGYITKNFAGFDDQMRLVQAITGATDADLAKLTETAKKLGRETSYTATQVASGMVALSRMGFTVNEVNGSIKDFMNLDRATGMNDLGMSAEIGAAAMRSFGLAASDSTRIADTLTATANGSAQTLGDLGEALKMAAPNARQANATLEDTCAMLGVLANLGIKGSMAGTALAKSFQRLASGKGVAVLEGTGIETKDANGNLRNMRDILIDIAKVTKNMGSADRIGFLTDVFDVRGAKGGGLISGNLNDLDAMIGKIINSSGVAEKTAQKMDSGIGGAFRILMSAVEGVGLEIGNIIGEALMPFIGSVTVMLGKLAEWVKANKLVVVNLLKLTAVLGGTGAALLAIGTAAKMLGFVLGGLAVAVKAVILTMQGIVIAAKAVAAAFTLLKGVTITFAALQAAVTACWKAVLLSPVSAVLAFAAGVGAIFYAVQDLTGAFTPLIASLKSLGSGFLSSLASIKQVALETYGVIKIALAAGDLAGAVKVGLAAVKVAWLTGLQPLRAAWYEFRNFLLDSWAIATGYMHKLGNNLWYGLLIGLKAIGNGIANTWDAIWNGILGAFESTIAYMQKQWVKFRSIFEGGIDVDAEIRNIDKETADKRANRERRSRENSSRRTSEARSLEREWTEANDEVDRGTQQKISDNRAGYDQSMREAAKGLADAQKDWRAAMDEVRKKASEKLVPEQKIEQQKQRLENAQTAVAEKAGKAAGTFNIGDLDALTSNAAVDEINGKMNNVVRLLDKTYKKIDNGGLTFK